MDEMPWLEKHAMGGWRAPVSVYSVSAEPLSECMGDVKTSVQEAENYVGWHCR